MKVFCNVCKDWLPVEGDDDMMAGYFAIANHAPDCPGDIKVRFNEIVKGLRL